MITLSGSGSDASVRDGRPAEYGRVIEDARMTTTFGMTDLGVIHLVMHVPASVQVRKRLARAVAQTLGSVGIIADRAHAGESTILVDLSVRVDEPFEPLVAALALWRSRLGSAPVPGATPPASPYALATALTFGDADDGPIDGGVLDHAPIDVLVAGGGDFAEGAARLRALRARLVEALASPYAAYPARPHRSIATETTEDPIERRWATIISLRSSSVRWYRFLPPPEGDDFLARSIANVQFGGVRDSALVTTMRRRGLSYSPQSSLVRYDGRDALIIDVPTSRGYEQQSNEAIGDALAEFSSSMTGDFSVETAIDYLIGRTLVDTDSLNGALAGAVAYLDGADASTRLSPEELSERMSTLDRDRIRTAATEFYRPDRFSALVLSADVSPEGWTAP